MMKYGAILALSAAWAGACGAQSLGSMAGIDIIDRDTGIVLSPYYYRGEYWVAGRPGARYAIEVRNHLGERLLAVTSVDGVNVLSGATAAYDQAGYVLDAGERYEITGWRKSNAEVADFNFTESPNAYAERTGRPANVGVIGVALFRERRPPAAYVAPPAPPVPSAEVAPLAQAASRAKLGTGHGEREYSYVTQTEFARMQPQPNETIRIRYDSLDNLIAMGIVKRSRLLPPSLNPFPGSPDPQYVPDPPG